MLFGKKAILQSGKHGMLSVHMDAFINVARETNYVYVVRNISPYATYFIAAGCPTKPFGVDVKSCKVGPFAGAFPMDPFYSHGPEKNYEAQAEAIKKALAVNKNFQAAPLVLDEQRLAWLSDQGLLTRAPHDGGFMLTWKNHAGQAREAYAIKNSAGTYNIQDKTGKALMALSQKIILEEKETVKPLTADYDLFGVFVDTQKLELGTLDHAPLSTQKSGPTEFKRLKKKDYRGPKEDPKMGNVTERMKLAILKANQAIAQVDPLRQIDELKVIHHNAEINSPKASDLKNSLPLILFLPLEAKHANKSVILIQTEEEATAVRELLVEAGIYWPYNELLSKHFSSFDQSQLSILTDPRGTRYRRPLTLQYEREFAHACGLMDFKKERKMEFSGTKNNAWWANAFREEQQALGERKNVFSLRPRPPASASPPSSGTPASASSGPAEEGAVASPLGTTPLMPSSTSPFTPTSIKGTLFSPPPVGDAPIDEKDSASEILGPRFDRSPTVMKHAPVLTFTGTIGQKGDQRDKKIINLQHEILAVMHSLEQDPSDQDAVDSLFEKYSELATKAENYKMKNKLSESDDQKLALFLEQTREWAKQRDITLRVIEVDKSAGRKVSSWVKTKTHVVVKKVATTGKKVIK